MGIAEAIKILKRHSKTLRKDIYEPMEAKILGIAIDRVLEEVQKKATK